MSAPPFTGRVAVVGAGTMGAGIVESCARAGIPVALYDVDSGAAARAAAAIESRLDRAVARGRLTDGAARVARQCLRTCADLADALSEVDLVVEAAPERLGLKLDVFRTLDALAPAQAVLATNTSGLSPSRLASVTSRPGLVLGMHFFNPVPRMRLVELVRADQTIDEAIERGRAVAHRMGKTVVVVDDAPGFVTTRLSALAGNEAFYVLMEGVASAEEIDEAVRSGANHPMGPLELADLVGLDVRLHILEHLHGALGEKFRPCPLLVRYVNAGRLGRKAGHGVYRYAPDGTRLPEGAGAQ